MKTQKLATHDSFFHADELFALAVLKLYLTKQGIKIKIIRSRDPKILAKCDYLVDVGRQYNPEKKYFDHHQVDESLTRENGIPYAAFGLVWKHFGQHLVSNKEIFNHLEKKLVQPIDALDNALKISKPLIEDLSEYNLAMGIGAISSAFPEEEIDKGFNYALNFVETVLIGEINRAEIKHHSEALVYDLIIKQNNPTILILDKYLPWKSATVKNKTIKFVIYPGQKNDKWFVQPAVDTLEDFAPARIPFPSSWMGKENEALYEVSQIIDAIFCHKSGYLGTAKTKEAAMEMARKALENQS